MVRDKLVAQSILPEQHFTQPPPRFTDASLVKRMEELASADLQPTPLLFKFYRTETT